MDSAKEETVLCPHCSEPMQLAESVFDGHGNVVARRYVHGCRETVTHVNVHAGQEGRPR